MGVRAVNEKRKSSAAGAARRTRKDGRSVIFKPIAWFAVICLVVYSVIVIISQQVQIVELRQEREEITAAMTEMRRRNDEYTRLLASDNESEYMEKIAIEKLGYAYPDERRFYVVEKH